jgi:predicted phage terminase large subunit-like protein
MSDDSNPSDDARRLLELEQEQWRRQCRSSFVSFCIEALSARGEQPARHHRLICEALQDVVEGRCKRLMILAPPGSAKTTYVSRLFPAFYFAHRPRSSIIACSHTQGLSELNSGFVQRYIRENPTTCAYNLIKDPGDANSTATGSVSKERWYTDNNCAFRAGSVGSAILGFRANIAIIDDPIRSRADAESETMRESDWQWFTNDLQTRLTPDGAIILIATPFHEDDLMGRLQRIQEGQWTILRLPAIADSEDDPLGRSIGEPLWADDRYGYGQRLLEIQAAAIREGRERDFYAMYQGRPRPPEGSMFKPNRMPVIEPDHIPQIIEQVRAWDLASSPRGDYTVGLLLGRYLDPTRFENRFIILDIVRFRGAPEDVRETVHATATRDGYGTRIWLPRDPAQAGADQVDSYIRMLSGFPVDGERMSGSKVVRADAAASQANIGRIALVRAPWNAAFIEEAASFPAGVHDDQIDALSLAFSKLEQTDLSVWLRL